MSGGPVIVSAYPPASPIVLPTSSFHTSHPALKASNKKSIPRIHSAQEPRSSSSASQHHDNGDIGGPIDLPRRKRVQSAVEPRQVVSVSLNNTPYGSKVWGQTSYRTDYEKKKPIPLPKVRPASATRMNNPHPSKLFLQWRIPTRIHKHERAVVPGADFLADVKEDFYKDYSSNVRSGDDKCEVPITNVAKIPFPGHTKNNELKLDGKCMTLATRGSTVSSLAGKSDNRQLLEEVLRPPSYAALKDWSMHAKDKEKQVFEKMLRVTNIKENDTKKVLAKVFNPNSMQHIQEWLQTIDSEEHEIALSVLQDLARRSQKYEKSFPHSHTHAKHCKAHHTWPRRKMAPVNHSKELGIQGVSVFRPHSACSHCSQNDIGATYNKHMQRQKIKTWKPEAGLWHHRVKPPQEPRLLNGGSLFCRPQQPRGQHFSIHPEWPIA